MTVIPTTPAQREALRQRFANILNSPEVARINFRYRGFHLRPGGYVVIAMSLATRSIHHPGESPDRRPMDVRVETMAAHVAAMYMPIGNFIVVPSINYGQTPADRAAIVHEATHAIFDYNGSGLLAFEEEACCYIANSMYSRILRESPPLATDAIGTAAWNIAAGLVAGHRMLRPWTDEITAAEMKPRLDALRASPPYGNLAVRVRNYHDGGTI